MTKQEFIERVGKMTKDEKVKYLGLYKKMLEKNKKRLERRDFLDEGLIKDIEWVVEYCEFRIAVLS